MAKIRSIVRPKGMNMPMIPVIIKAMRAPKRKGPIPEKSYLDCNVNRVKPMKTPRVINLEGSIEVCPKSEGKCSQCLKDKVGVIKGNHYTKREGFH